METNIQTESIIEGDSSELVAEPVEFTTPSYIIDTENAELARENDAATSDDGHVVGEYDKFSDDAEALKEELDKIVVVSPEPDIPYVVYLELLCVLEYNIILHAVFITVKHSALYNIAHILKYCHAG